VRPFIYNGDGASSVVNNVTIYSNAVLPDGGGDPGTGGIFNESSGSVRLSNSIVAVNAFGSTYTGLTAWGPSLGRVQPDQESGGLHLDRRHREI
jgi:hypothetical protein